MPNFGEAHWGAGAEQSAQTELLFVLAISISCGGRKRHDQRAVLGKVGGEMGGKVGKGRGVPLTASPDQPPTSPWTPLKL